jgi:peptidoglycan-associated lipoprotein
MEGLMKRIGLLVLMLALAGYFSGCGKKPKPVTDKPPVTETKRDEPKRDEPKDRPTEDIRSGEVNFVKIYFDFDRYNIRPDARMGLETNARVLRDNRNMRIQIEGHCDERGTVEYNLALGERRAASARQYLMDLGIDGGRMTTISYGKERPVAFGHDEASWQLNRRAEFVVTSR